MQTFHSRQAGAPENLKKALSIVHLKTLRRKFIGVQKMHKKRPGFFTPRSKQKQERGGKDI